MNTQVAILVITYLVGIVLIGVPMSKLSLWLYTLGGELDYRSDARLLKLVRNFLHPGSFGWAHRPDRRNFQMNYEGPISSFVDLYSLHDQTDRLKYLVFASLAWPGKLFLSLIDLQLFISLSLIASPFYLLGKVCESANKR